MHAAANSHHRRSHSGAQEVAANASPPAIAHSVPSNEIVFGDTFKRTSADAAHWNTRQFREAIGRRSVG